MLMTPRDPAHALDGRQVVLRPATRHDRDAIVRIWATGWRDAHEGHVPAELTAARPPASFRAHFAERIDRTTVLEVDGDVAGFVTVVDDEVEQLYLDRDWRGSGVANLLLAEAERRVADADYDRAWLAVVAGNTRARRFYHRAGWRDDGEAVYAAFAGSGGSPVSVLVRRYVKDLETRPSHIKER